MYINCYSADEIDFNHHGEFKIGIESEENNIYRSINGQFYATFKVSLSDKNVFNVMHRMIVKLPTPNKVSPYQLFRIVDSSEDVNGVVFTAFHITWDLATDFLPHVNIVAKTRKEACEYILQKAQEVQSHRFKVIDKENPQVQKNLQIVRCNPLVALMGNQDNTVLMRFGSTEFDFDNFTISVQDRIGQDTDFLIKDNKNIISYNKNLDFKPLATRLVPQGGDELMLPEYYVDSPKIGDYDRIFYKHVKFEEIRVDDENGITEEIAVNLLREAAIKLFSESNIDSPQLNWTIVFDDGQNNPNIPQELKALLYLDLGDSILVSKKGLFERLTSRILEYNYNFVKRSYSDITISSTSKSFTVSLDKTVADLTFKVDTFNSTISDLTKDVYSKIEQSAESIEIKVNKTIKDTAEATLENAIKDTDGKLNDYSTTKEMSAAITQSAGEIKLSVTEEVSHMIEDVTETTQEIIDNIESMTNDNEFTPDERAELKFEFDRMVEEDKDIGQLVRNLDDDIVTGYHDGLYKTSWNDLFDFYIQLYHGVDVAEIIYIDNEAFLLALNQYKSALSNIERLINESYITSITKNSTEIIQNSEKIGLVASQVEEVEGITNEISSHFDFTQSGFVEIYASKDGQPQAFKTQITDQELNFQENGKKVAFISRQKLYITDAEVTDELQIGNFIIGQSATGGIIFR